MSTNDLQERIEKLGRRLLEDIEKWEERSRPARRGEGGARQAQPDRAERVLTRRELKEARRDQRKARKQQEALENASLPGALVLVIAALGFASFALMNPHMWWLLFVAFGLGSGGAQQFALVQRRNRELGQSSGGAPVQLQSPTSPVVNTSEIDVLCDQLLADLKASPDAVRAFVVNPEKTIESLRATCHSLAARRQQLGAERALERINDVERQKRDLVLRRDAAGDETARQKLNDALGSLESQVGALRQLSAAHERVDGEYTSLLVTLQELRTRVSLAKSAGSSVQLEGLRQSVGRLNAELSAITDALASPQQQAVVPISEASEERDPVTGKVRE